MAGDYDMNNHTLVNVKDPSSDKHAAHKKYVDDEITSRKEEVK